MPFKSPTSSFILATFLPCMAIAQNPNTFQVAFWEGRGCSSASTGVVDGPLSMDGRSFCYDIPEIGVTQAFDFYGADDNYRIQLHADSSCIDTQGLGYRGRPDVPICVETYSINGAVAYSVYQEVKQTSRRSLTRNRRVLRAEPVMDSILLESASGNSSHLVARSGIDSFVLSGTVGAFSFGIADAEYCPRAIEPEGRRLATYLPCGISATATLVFSFMTAFGNTGEESKKDQDSSKRRRTLLELDDLTTFVDPLVPSYNFSITKMGSESDQFGDKWDSVLMDIVHEESGETSQATYKTHAPTDRHVVSSAITGSSTDNALEERSSNYYAYYTWTDSNRNIYNRRTRGTQAINKLTAQLWNYGRRNDLGIYCANFAVDGARENTGIFSMTNTVFAPDFFKCNG